MYVYVRIHTYFSSSQLAVCAADYSADCMPVAADIPGISLQRVVVVIVIVVVVVVPVVYCVDRLRSEYGVTVYSYWYRMVW